MAVFTDQTTAMSIFLIVSSIVCFISLQFIPAPYGRYSRDTWSKFSLNPKLSWCIQEMPSFLIPALFFIKYFDNLVTQVPNLVLLCLFGGHYFHRSFLYASKIVSNRPVPLLITLSALFVCSYNGFLQGSYLATTPYEKEWLLHPVFAMGILLFFVGMFINIHSDHILFGLRTGSEKSYKIPRGGLFEYVSGANYLGEIVEWLGFAIASLSMPSFAFFVLTVCNIGPRAKQHHEWYKKQFEDYPVNRKALIPFLW